MLYDDVDGDDYGVRETEEHVCTYKTEKERDEAFEDFKNKTHFAWGYRDFEILKKINL